MNTKRMIRLLLLIVLAGGLVLSGCTLTPTPDPYETWSTNFIFLPEYTDEEYLSLNQIAHEQDYCCNHTGVAHLSLDTTNVNSGGKSIKDTGMVVNGQLELKINFTPQGLIQKDAFDLSGKTLSIEAYLPEDSPFPLLLISLGSEHGSLTVRPGIHPEKGRWYTYDVDLNAVITLATWQSETYMYTGVSSRDDAINLVLKQVRYIQFIAASPNCPDPNNPGCETYILIDRLGWKPSDPFPAYDPTAESLRRYAEARGLTLAANIDPIESSDPHDTEFFFRQFSMGNYNVSNVSSWPSVPELPPANYNYNAFVHNMGMKHYLDSFSSLTGGKLIRTMIFPGGTGIPDYLKAPIEEREALYDRIQSSHFLNNYVRAMARAYRGKTKIWIMFAEMLNNRIVDQDFQYSGLGLKNILETPERWDENYNYSPFSRDASDITLIADAFQTVRDTDPEAWLFLKDYSMEEKVQRADATFNLVQTLVYNGTPIDGVAIEAHVCVNQDGTLDMKYPYSDDMPQVVANIDRYKALKPGFKVIFAEVDVCVYNSDVNSSPAGQLRLSERLQKQAEVYRSLMHISLANDMPVFVFWSWADRWSYIGYDPGQKNKEGNFGYPGIVDADWKPRLSYYALLEELKDSTSPGPFLKTWPANGVVDQPSNPTLRWTASRGANKYEFCIDTSSNYSCHNWISAGNHTSVEPHNLIPGRKYYWQVRAVDGTHTYTTEADRGSWGSFTVSQEPLLELHNLNATASSCQRDPSTGEAAPSCDSVPFPPIYAVDGNHLTRWGSAFDKDQPLKEWIQVDLGQPYAIRRIEIDWTESYATEYEIQVSDNGIDFTPIYYTNEGDGGMDWLSVNSTGRYVKIIGQQRVTIYGHQYGYSLFEVEVYVEP